MSDIAALVSAGVLLPKITESFPLEDFETAFQLISERRARGKVILQIA
jgi:NADPH:quinone reductase-like Zn-dependent oxidoreductase